MTDPLPNPLHPIGPGWYPDPQHPMRVRWWDGSVWTDEWRPREMQAQYDALRTYDASRTATGDVPAPVTQYAYSMTWWAHVLWFLASAATFGFGVIGWIGWGFYRHYNPRRVSVTRV